MKDSEIQQEISLHNFTYSLVLAIVLSRIHYIIKLFFMYTCLIFMYTDLFYTNTISKKEENTMEPLIDNKGTPTKRTAVKDGVDMTNRDNTTGAGEGSDMDKEGTKVNELVDSGLKITKTQ